MRWSGRRFRGWGWRSQLEQDGAGPMGGGLSALINRLPRGSQLCEDHPVMLDQPRSGVLRCHRIDRRLHLLQHPGPPAQRPLGASPLEIDSLECFGPTDPRVVQRTDLVQQTDSLGRAAEAVQRMGTTEADPCPEGTTFPEDTQLDRVGDLPQPDSLTTPRASPCSTPREIPSKARTEPLRSRHRRRAPTPLGARARGARHNSRRSPLTWHQWRITLHPRGAAGARRGGGARM